MSLKLPALNWHARVLACSLLAVLPVQGLASRSTRADEPTVPIRSQAGRPVVPALERRPVQGTTPETRWQLQRDADDREPTASFMSPVQSADAIVEVIVGQGKLVTMRQPIANPQRAGLIAVGDPNVVDFEVMPNPRMVRLEGKRPGVTDLSITTADDKTFVIEVHVVYDLELLTAQLNRLFPEAEIRLAQLRSNLILDGQARNIREAAAIEQTLRGFLASIGASASRAGGPRPHAAYREPNEEPASGAEEGVPEPPPAAAPGAMAAAPGGAAAAVAGGAAGVISQTQIVNRMRVPGVQQVMLQVKIGELNRTALREIGADWLFRWAGGNTIGTRLNGATLGPSDGIFDVFGLGTKSTAFGVFPSGSVAVVLKALRENAVLNVLAEPNLIALSGQRASFLAGGQFPVPVPQSGGTVAGAGVYTVQWKDFGVQLNFVPQVIDEETIRLQVSPEVSSIDEAIGTELSIGMRPVPGLNTRKVDTTVELKQGNTLALAGLIQVELDARTQRIPLLGDLPYLGPLFSNTSHRRVEKELVVLVTPYLIQPMTPDQVPPVPGEEIKDPKDCEFYFLNRIEGRTGQYHRATTSWDDPLHLVELLKLNCRYVSGPLGYSE